VRGQHARGIAEILATYRAQGIRRLVALRGDLPSGTATAGEFRYAADLIEPSSARPRARLAHRGRRLPRVPPAAALCAADLQHFAAKVKAGADSAITQFFFNPDAYFHFVDEVRKRWASTCPSCRASCRSTTTPSIAQFAARDGIEIPRWVALKMEGFMDDAASVRAFGIDVVARLCERLIAGGAPGIHFYTLNQSGLTLEICQAALAASEALLRRVTALAPGVVFQVHIAHDGTRRYLFVSEGVHPLFGVTPSEVLADSRRLDGLRYPEDAARFERERLAADAQGRALVGELRMRAPDGKTRWTQVNSALMGRDDAGTLRSGFIIDISDRKRAEAALRENEERWKLALEASGDGVWDWDLVSGREVLSPRFMQMYGYDGEETVGTACEFDTRVHPDDAEQMDRSRREHLAGRTPSYVNEHRVRCRDGRWKWILTRGLVIARDAEGRPLRMIGTHTDIDARKQAEALRLERDRAAAADQAKTELLSRISHELRTPLNALLGFTQLLDTDAATAPHQRAWVQQMLSSGRHLLALVNDALPVHAVLGEHGVQRHVVRLGVQPGHEAVRVAHAHGERARLQRRQRAVVEAAAIAQAQAAGAEAHAGHQQQLRLEDSVSLGLGMP
jgi:PAS domain S-box-containing protein